MVDINRIPHSLELMTEEGRVELSYIDQRKLPDELVIETTADWKQVVYAIQTLAVRGAPAIGIGGAAALALFVTNNGVQCDLEWVAEEIASARPTAVNLRWAINRSLEEIREVDWSDVPNKLINLVLRMEAEDEATNRTIGHFGAALLGDGSNILTHCNAGSLATYFYGTALGIVYCAAEQGKINRVFADETRPVGQGARLTAWVLARAGVPVTLICDDMAASLMAQGTVDAVLVGADRIARNGDTANKIGTYGLAVLAHEHGIPFYVAAPRSTIDFNLEDGSQIIIEQRSPEEVLQHPINGVDVWNPAFDVTPARYITGIVTEAGVFSPSDLASLDSAVL